MTSRPTSYSLIALPFSRNASRFGGTRNAPDTILNELAWLDAWELSFGRDPLQDIPRNIVQAHESDLIDPMAQIRIAEHACISALSRGAFPICLGGERMVSLGPIRAARAGGPLGVIHLGAHADLKNNYLNDSLSSYCTMRRAVEYDCQTLGIGIRNLAEEERTLVRNRQALIVSGSDIATTNAWYSLVTALPERIYLSIDMSIFDPAEVCASCRPAPGGPSWSQTLEFITWLFSQKNVVAADITELCPGADAAASTRAAARLVTRLIGLQFP